jgi:hypothetical protein
LTRVVGWRVVVAGCCRVDLTCRFSPRTGVEPDLASSPLESAGEVTGLVERTNSVLGSLLRIDDRSPFRVRLDESLQLLDPMASREILVEHPANLLADLLDRIEQLTGERTLGCHRRPYRRDECGEGCNRHRPTAAEAEAFAGTDGRSGPYRFRDDREMTITSLGRHVDT